MNNKTKELKSEGEPEFTEINHLQVEAYQSQFTEYVPMLYDVARFVSGLHCENLSRIRALTGTKIVITDAIVNETK